MEQIILKINDKEIIASVRNTGDRSVAAEIFNHREYKLSEEAIINAEHTIIDVGAHIGLFSLYCRALNEKVKIIALEPEPENFALLKDNLEANDTENIEIEKVALSKKASKQLLKLDEQDRLNNYLIVKEDLKKARSVLVNTDTFSEICKKYNIDRISLLKMDIEGGEYDVLKSLTHNDFNKIESVILEYHEDKKQNHKELEIILRENGFSVTIFPSKFDKKMGFIFARNKRM